MKNGRDENNRRKEAEPWNVYLTWMHNCCSMRVHLQLRCSYFSHCCPTCAKKERADAVVFKEEYETKLKEVDKEAQVILSEARKKAMKTESQIVAEAKEEAARIIARANAEVELEKKRALDEMKQEMVAIASLMAGKVVKASIDTNVQESLIDETLKEMGERTWLS